MTHTKHRPKILFICKQRHAYGAYNDSHQPYSMSSGLFNSARFVSDMMNKAGIESHLVDVIDNNCIDKEVTKYRPTHVIIEALWVVPSKFEVLTKLHPKVKWIIRLHSEIPFIANEGIAMEWIYDYLKFKNVTIAVNSKRIQDELNEVLPKECILLPNYYPVNFKNKNHHIEHNHHVVKIGCFGTIRPMKNQLMQAIAAIKFANNIGKKLEFHINVPRIENRGESVLKNIRNLFANNTKHELVEHGWLKHHDFVKIVREMDICMQVSFSETFNIVSADAVNNNIPIIASNEVRWVSSFYKADPNDSESIIKKLHFAWKFRKIGLQFVNKLLLSIFSEESEVIWTHYFTHNHCECNGNCQCD